MKIYDRIRVNQWFLATIGVLMLALSCAGLFHAVRATWAAHWSRKAQCGPPTRDVEQVLECCRRAFVLYRWNYYLSTFAAEWAYYKADEVGGDLKAERMRQAELWCERGLMQNGYKSQLRRLKTRFLWERSPAEAIAYWESHTHWQYWEPYNHETLAELYAKYGELDKATCELKLIENFPAYEATRAVVENERKFWTE